MFSSTRALLAGLMAVSAAGATDVGEFLATRMSMFTDAPGRAGGSLLGLVFWLALLGVASRRYIAGDRPATTRLTLALAAMVASGNVGLTLIHLKAGVGGWRPILGGGLGMAALLLALASRSAGPSSKPDPLRQQEIAGARR